MVGDLTDLADIFGTDKGTWNPRTRIPGHCYTPIYEQLFEKWRNEPITMLEIGVFKGASLRMWEAWFTRAKVVGVDLRQPPGTFERAEVVIADQSRAEDMEALGRNKGPFDLVIDDGSHILAHQLTTFFTLFPRHVKPGGIYAIEDAMAFYDKTFLFFSTLNPLPPEVEELEIECSGKLLIMRRKPC